MVDRVELEVKDEVANARSGKLKGCLSLGYRSIPTNLAKGWWLTDESSILAQGDRERPHGESDPETPD